MLLAFSTDTSFWSVTLSLLDGLWVSGKLFFLTLLFALPLGLLICLASTSKFSPLRWLTKIFVWIIRGSPLMLQILIVYYGPGLFAAWLSSWTPWTFSVSLLPRFTAALVTFSINYACYFSEIYRGGIQSIPKGQYEAGQVLGMSKSQIFFRVTLLQLIKRIVPPMGNEFITLVKDTAYIQESDAQWKNRKAERSGAPKVEPLYTIEDASRVREFLTT
ncbi:MAG: amino acid ABC transporter permease, partial [Clostridia bacterium]|nr:amino acid ABC transporter permease [Clostridia bacterium]